MATGGKLTPARTAQIAKYPGPGQESFRGEWSEFPAAAAVPNEVAREAIREFATGEKPENLRWEMD